MYVYNYICVWIEALKGWCYTYFVVGSRYFVKIYEQNYRVHIFLGEEKNVDNYNIVIHERSIYGT